LRNQSGNLFFSPASISTALAMTYAGARGETATEMAKTLHFTLPPERLRPAMGALLSDLNAAHDGYQLRVANALWVQQGYVFLDDFLKLTKDDYGAGLNQVDFKSAAEVARRTINQWVEQKTENKIKDLLQPGALKPEARLVLTDAIYFKGDWQTQFKKEDTKNEDFHVSSMQTIKTPMMHLHHTGGVNYMNGVTFQALEIPYKGKDLSMIIFLPNAVDGLPTFEQSLTPAKIRQWLGELWHAWEINVTMPKFKVTWQFELKDTLGTIEMQQAFGPIKADFSGMASKEEIQRAGNLYVNAVIHKAYVDVNEAGTEAAAATAVAMMSLSMCCPPPPPPPVVFRADHPFLFVIRDNHSGGIVFMGRVTDPSK
jgi:serine protease inhibitor